MDHHPWSYDPHPPPAGDGDGWVIADHRGGRVPHPRNGQADPGWADPGWAGPQPHPRAGTTGPPPTGPPPGWPGAGAAVAPVPGPREPYHGEPYPRAPSPRDPHPPGAYQREPYPPGPYPRHAHPQEPYPRHASPQEPYPRHASPREPYAREPYPSDPYPPGRYPSGPYPHHPAEARPSAAGPAPPPSAELADEEEPEPRPLLAPALAWTIGVFVVPMLVYLGWAFTRSGGAPAGCAEAVGAACRPPRVEAAGNLLSALPALAGALGVALLVTVGLRRLATSWRAGSVGVAAAVIGGGIATVIGSILG